MLSRGFSGGALACGLGPGSALTIHRIVIHYRTEALRASRHRTGLAPIRSMRQRLQKSTPKGAFLWYHFKSDRGAKNNGILSLVLYEMDRINLLTRL
jgi:hypothetical protein